MSKLFDPEVLHLVFALGGAVFGWWLHAQHGSAGVPGVPAELAGALRNLLDRKKQQEAHGLLEELVSALRGGQTPPQPPRAGG